MKALGHSAKLDFLLELGAGNAAFQADINSAAGAASATYHISVFGSPPSSAALAAGGCT